MRRALALLLALSAAAPVGAQTRRDERLPNGADSGENVLRIPGLPPIPLPPGARVVGPRDDDAPPPRSVAPPPVEAKPVETKPTQTKPDAPGQPAQRLPAAVVRKNVLDELFKRLAAARDLEEAKGVEGAIERVWLRSGSDTTDLLMSRALAVWQANDFSLARSLLDRVVALEPDWAEGWNKRATLRFLMDDPKGAQSDAERALLLEPRHYGALAGLGIIFEQAGDKKRALEALRKARMLDPQRKDIADKVEQLRFDVEGRDI